MKRERKGKEENYLMWSDSLSNNEKKTENEEKEKRIRVKVNKQNVR
jgi:hypothetical protein